MPLGRNQFSYRWVGKVAWGVLGAACTTPTFDALDGAPVAEAAAAADAGASAPSLFALCRAWQGSSALPEGGEGLIGRYAARLDSYGFDDIAAIHAREHERRIAVADIAQGPAGLEMALQTCDWSSSYRSLGTLLTATSGPRAVASLPARTLRMTFGPDCSWSAAPVSAQLWGYSAASPAGCAPGATLPRAPQQSWLAVSCRCPVDDGPLPSDASDCRVGDPDADGHPGVTLEWRNEELGSEVYYVAMRDQSELVQGAIDAQGVLTARERRSDAFVQLGGDFPRTKNRCPDDTSRVILKRLVEVDGDACPEALRAFWAEAEPEFPERECAGQ